MQEVCAQEILFPKEIMFTHEQHAHTRTRTDACSGPALVVGTLPSGWERMPSHLPAMVVGGLTEAAWEG